VREKWGQGKCFVETPGFGQPAPSVSESDGVRGRGASWVFKIERKKYGKNAGQSAGKKRSFLLATKIFYLFPPVKTIT